METSDRKRKVGGFVGLNTGVIEDSYSRLTFSDKHSLAGGFSADNRGEIKGSYACGISKNLNGGFVGMSSGSLSECQFVHNLTEKQVSAFSDSQLGIKEDDLEIESDIFEKATGSAPIRFISKNWFYDIPESDTADRPYIEISTIEELKNFRDRVNSGDKDAQNAYVLLKKDLDFGSKTWTPVGTSEKNAFCGIFNGNGHCITDFRCDKSGDYQGFFGILKGEVYNLIVDVGLSSAKAVGGMAAQNYGVIGCSGAVVSIKGNTRFIGGFVGVNKGRIFRCYSGGKMNFVAVPPLFLAFLIVLLAGIGLILFFLFSGEKPDESNQSVFNPIPIDTRQEVIEDEDEPDDSDSGSTAENSLSYGINSTITLSLSRNECVIGLENGAKSNKRMTAKITMQNADGTEFTIAETNAVEPKHKISAVAVDDFALDKLAVGKYNARAYIYFYNEDNSLSMVNAALDVILEVKE